MKTFDFVYQKIPPEVEPPHWGIDMRLNWSSLRPLLERSQLQQWLRASNP